MNGALLGLFGLSAFLLAYRFYGNYISNKIFELGDLDDSLTPTPAVEFNDGEDYVPSKTGVLIGHHFSSIAGAAPIVGPAVAAIWGWAPAFLWIIFGVIFIGACHDFGTLVVSMKHKGQSLAIVASELLGKRVRNLILVVIFFLVWMVIAVFALVIANLFISFPSTVLPVNFQIIVALIMGVLINKKGGSLTLPSIIAQVCLYGMIYLGSQFPITLGFFGGHELMAWMVILLVYSLVASVLPVWMLLQPRDYINGHQLALGLCLMVVGLFIVQPEIVAPAVNLEPVGAPPWFPFLFITIACGAISGFHGLVSGGTTSKQISKWRSARPVAFGGMLGEGLLALLATLAVTAGFDSTELWHSHYSSWDTANGLSAKIGAFVTGSAKFITGLGIPNDIGETIMAVMVISFAATSLDTACRIQRYIIGEVGQSLKMKTLENKYVGSAIAVLSAFLLMLSSDGGKGGLLIWPLFGATNQMLAVLSLMVISLYLIKNKKNALPFLIPTIFIAAVTAFGLFYNIQSFYVKENFFLMGVTAILAVIEVWVFFEVYIQIRKLKK